VHEGIQSQGPVDAINESIRSTQRYNLIEKKESIAQLENHAALNPENVTQRIARQLFLSCQLTVFPIS
jgi:hypothetical protein